MIARLSLLMLLCPLLYGAPCVQWKSFIQPLFNSLSYGMDKGHQWHPVCLNQLKPQTTGSDSKTDQTVVLSNQDIKAFSDRSVFQTRSPAEKLSLKGTPPEYFAALATDSQNATTQISSYNGMPAGVDLFGIRTMFVAPSATSITSNFGARDLHSF